MDAEQPIINILGEKLAPGPVRRGLIPLYCRWANDLDFTRTAVRSPPLTLEQQMAMYDKGITIGGHVSFITYDCPVDPSVLPCWIASITATTPRSSASDSARKRIVAGAMGVRRHD